MQQYNLWDKNMEDNSSLQIRYIWCRLDNTVLRSERMAKSKLSNTTEEWKPRLIRLEYGFSFSLEVKSLPDVLQFFA